MGQLGIVWANLTTEHLFSRQYRLCPAGKPLTEACFAEMPLALAGFDEGIV